MKVARFHEPASVEAGVVDADVVVDSAEVTAPPSPAFPQDACVAQMSKTSDANAPATRGLLTTMMTNGGGALACTSTMQAAG